MPVAPASNTHLIDTQSSQITTPPETGNNGEDDESEQYDQISVDHHYNYIENNYADTNQDYYSSFQILPILNAINPTPSLNNEHPE